MKRLLFFILFLGILVSFANEGWVKLYKLRQFEKTLDGENRAIARNNNSLRGEIQNLGDPKYLDLLIRRETGFIRDNEIMDGRTVKFGVR